MSTKIGNFEVQSELAKSQTGTVYKANDLQSGQIIALKAILLSAFGEHAAALEKSLCAEADKAKVLSSSNITTVYSAGEIEGRFCAAMEYVEGNSIATMLARKEGFSIWDLLDIGRQACSALDYAHSNEIFHYSLEPAKVMCGWDGTVKILSFGVSSVGRFVPQDGDTIPSICYYMSPEQMRGEEINHQSNLFSLGAIFYEMVTERKPFDAADFSSLQQQIQEGTPAAPVQLNPKLHPLLSDLIVKAMAKDPSQRYQSGRELLDDLEKCKESKPQGTKQPSAAPNAPAMPSQVKAAAQARFAGALPAQTTTNRAASSGDGRRADLGAQPTATSLHVAASKAKAAAAGLNGQRVSTSTHESFAHGPAGPSVGREKIAGSHSPSPTMSYGAVEGGQIETFTPYAPKVAVDPLMAEDVPGGRQGRSFSDIAELPPLKEVYSAPAPPSPTPAEASASSPSVTVFQGRNEKLEKLERPKIQPREAAQKAIKEIKGVPPRLMLFSIAAAIALILIIAAAMTIHIHGFGGDEDSGAPPVAQQAQAPVSSAKSQPASVEPAPVAAEAEAQPPESPEHEPAAPRPTSPRAGLSGRNARRKPAAPVIVPGELTLDSSPQGAQIQVDGYRDASWITPITLTGLQPGRHSITLSKGNYSNDTRTVDVASGSKSTVLVHLAPLMATLSLSSDPPGANIYVDGRDMGKTTPAHLTVDKGQHVLLIRKMGYIDETTTGQFVPGQTFSFSPTMRALGNVDNIKTVGKMKKLFGGKGGEPGQATVSIHTQPKGAQIAINQHMLEKNSPVEVMLDPGNYVIDITLSGYAPVHTIITAEKSGKVTVDEVLRQQ
jgi:eukaryotic-like serine/threonine-protein kinase